MYLYNVNQHAWGHVTLGGQQGMSLPPAAVAVAAPAVPVAAPTSRLPLLRESEQQLDNIEERGGGRDVSSVFLFLLHCVAVS